MLLRLTCYRSRGWRMGSPSLPYGSPYAAADQGTTRTKAAPSASLVTHLPRGFSLLMPKPITRYAAARTKTIPIKHAGVKSIPPLPSPIRRSTGHPGQWSIALLGDELSATHGLPRGRSPGLEHLPNRIPLVFPQSWWGKRDLFTPEPWGTRKCSKGTLLISLGIMVLPVRIELTTSPLPKACSTIGRGRACRRTRCA